LNFAGQIREVGIVDEVLSSPPNSEELHDGVVQDELAALEPVEIEVGVSQRVAMRPGSSDTARTEED